MAGERNSLRDQQLRTLWESYLSNLATLAALDLAIKEVRSALKDHQILAQKLLINQKPFELVEPPEKEKK